MKVYVDGSGLATGGPAGVGYVAYGSNGAAPLEGSLPIPHATNQQAELLAAAYAMHMLPAQPVLQVWSDSQYVVNGYGKVHGWRARGWRRDGGGAVANVRHWERLLLAASKHNSVTFHWLKGHAKDEGNERADLLAGDARQRAKLAYGATAAVPS